MTSRSRRDPFREPATIMIVVTEGEKTEPRYLEAFRKIHVHPRVKKSVFDLRIIPGIGVPKTVVDRAIQELQNLQRLSSGKGSVWAMFDRDEHPRFEDAKREARSRGVHLAMSNPCFEIWGIYHYEDCQAYIKRDQCQKKLEELCSSYDRESGKIFEDKDAIKNKYSDAIKRAEKSLNLREQEGTPEDNPSTSIHCLTEKILSTVEDLIRSNRNSEG